MGSISLDWVLGVCDSVEEAKIALRILSEALI